MMLGTDHELILKSHKQFLKTQNKEFNEYSITFFSIFIKICIRCSIYIMYILKVHHVTKLGVNASIFVILLNFH